jgi:hypothetical protein
MRVPDSAPLATEPPSGIGRPVASAARRCLVASAALLALSGAALAPSGAEAQVRFRGVGDPDLDAMLLRFIADGEYRLVTADTTLALGDTLQGPVLVLRARFSIAGHVEGELVAVDANVFVRPTGSISGDAWNLGGGYYPSDQATVAGRVRDYPLAPYRVERDRDLYIVRGLAHEAAFIPDGLYGVSVPTYDRVDGVGVPVGARFVLPPWGRVRPTIAGRVVYRSERGDWDGGGYLDLARGRARLRLGGERATATSDAWIRGDLVNSAAFLFAGNDLRDYYRSDRVHARLELRRGSGGWIVTPFLQAQWEDAGRLRAGDPWTLFEPDSIRPNRVVVPAPVVSGLIGMDAAWTTDRSRFVLAAEVEVGAPEEQGSDPPVCDPASLCPLAGAAAIDALALLFGNGDVFTRVTVDGEWESPALADHTLRAGWHLQAPIGSDALPLRRWSHVGGPATIPTLGDAERQGDRVVLVRTGYGVPVPLAIPILGPPELELVHVFGGAWSLGGDDSLDQNIGLRLRFSLGWVRVMTDPTDFGEDVVFDFGINTAF